MSEEPGKRRTIIVTAPRVAGQWFVAVDIKTGTVSQGRTLRNALGNLGEAIELYENTEDE